VTQSQKSQLPKEKEYAVVMSTESYKGKTYSEWIADWVNWFFRADPEEENFSGPVVFLKQYPRIPDSSHNSREENSPILEIIKNDPNVMVGGDKIEIFSDQGILFPVIMAYWIANEPIETEEYMRQKVRSDIDNGDNPPRLDQVTINGREIKIRDPNDPDSFINEKLPEEIRKEMRKYRIETSLFSTMVASTEYGLSYKDIVEYPTVPGTANAVVCGYYFLITDLEEGRYVIHSHARGRSTEKGEYFAELLYDINVVDRKQKTLSPQSGKIPERITQRLIYKLQDQLDRNLITPEDFEMFKDIIEQSRKKQQDTIINVRKISKLM
jgi:hypothetical protein